MDRLLSAVCPSIHRSNITSYCHRNIILLWVICDIDCGVLQGATVTRSFLINHFLMKKNVVVKIIIIIFRCKN